MRNSSLVINIDTLIGSSIVAKIYASHEIRNKIVAIVIQSRPKINCEGGRGTQNSNFLRDVYEGILDLESRTEQQKQQRHPASNIQLP